MRPLFGYDEHSAIRLAPGPHPNFVVENGGNLTIGNG